MEQTIPKLMRKAAQKYPEITAQYSRTKTGDFEERNYHDMLQFALDFAGGLAELGVVRGEKIGLISDNRREWESADVGLLALGAIDCPRGCDASESDLAYILSFAEVTKCIVENAAQLRKLVKIKDKVPLLKMVICFDPVDQAEIDQCKASGMDFYQFYDVTESGHEWRINHPDYVENELDKGQWDELATIIFTSGTTGTPKGVMLTHGNIITQLDEVCERVFLNPGERAVCCLPVWHVFQRAIEYVIFTQGAGIVYSKPIGSILLSDIAKMNPALLPAVPRVFEAVYDGIWRKMRKTGGIVYAMFRFFVAESHLWCAIDRKLRRRNARFGHDYLGFWWPVLVLPWLLLYPPKLLGKLLVFSKIKKMLGKNFRAGIAGGGAYPARIDKFFWAVGINIVEGYGLTETSPVVAVRPIVEPVMRTVGTPVRGVQVRIVDDDGLILGKGKKGSLQVKGGTVMQGYYKRDDLTAKVMTADGWFDTGDLAILTVDGEIQLRGRKKDTIVLMGGENIEPQPIEQKICTSQYIDTAVVLGTNAKGEDQRYLVSLILPNQEEIEKYARDNSLIYDTYENLVKSESIVKLIGKEIGELVSTKNGFKPFEKINKFEIITKPFEVGVELSAKQEVMRYRIAEIYKEQLTRMYAAQ